MTISLENNSIYFTNITSQSPIRIESSLYRGDFVQSPKNTTLSFAILFHILYIYI